SACRWCPVAGMCRVRKEQLIDRDFGQANLLSPQELAEAHSSLKEIEAWCTSVREVSLELAYHQGGEIPGYTVVRARARRKTTAKGSRPEGTRGCGPGRRARSPTSQPPSRS